jgi:transposase
MQGKEQLIERVAAAVYVGVDVSQATLDVHLHPTGVSLRVANSTEGLRALKRKLKPYPVCRIVMEATGKWHRHAHRSLHAGGYAVAVVNPYRSRKLADALGALAKTDRIDARVLALFAEALAPACTEPDPKPLAEIKELVLARNKMAIERGALEQRVAASDTAFLRRELERLLKALERSLERLQTEIVTRIENDPQLAARYAILMSVPGIGPVVAATLLTCLAELGHLDAKAIAALAGLAPMNWDSGVMRGHRHIKGGRGHVRRLLRMAALGAIRWNKSLRVFYERLLANGKTFAVAITAVMRKLVVLANTLLSDNRHWQPEAPKIS